MENKEKEPARLDYREDLRQLEKNLNALGYGEFKISTHILERGLFRYNPMEIRDFVENYPFNPAEHLPLKLIYHKFGGQPGVFTQNADLLINYSREKGFYMDSIYATRLYENQVYPSKYIYVQIGIIPGCKPRFQLVIDQLEKGDQYREQINKTKLERVFEFDRELYPTAPKKRLRRKKIK